MEKSFMFIDFKNKHNQNAQTTQVIFRFSMTMTFFQKLKVAFLKPIQKHTRYCSAEAVLSNMS